jgi:hypothetical protein
MGIVKPLGVTKANKVLMKGYGAVKTLMRHASSIPPHAQEKLRGFIIDIGEDPSNLEEAFSRLHIEYKRGGHLIQRAKHILAIAADGKNPSEVDILAIRLRTAFVDKLKPKYLPEGWLADRPLYSEMAARKERKDTKK